MKRNGWRVVFGGFVLSACLAATTVRAADEPAPETVTDASQGFVTFKSGDNSLTLGAWGQFRMVVDDRDEYDNDTAGSGLGVADGTSVAFSVHKLRPYILGTVYKPWLKYKFEFELGPLATSATSNVNNARLTDAFVEIAKLPAATLRIGQYKVPFGLQELTPDTKQEFVDRSIANAKFAPSRDIGLMLFGTFWEKKLGYQAGLFNGAGQNNPQEDEGLLYAVRVYVDPLGEYKMFESGNDATDANVLHFGLGYRGGEVTKQNPVTGVFEDPNDETAWNAEVAWRWKRLFAMAEYFAQTDEQTNPAGPDVDANGFHAQLGFMIHPKQHEIAVRYAEIEPDDTVSDAKQTEIRAVYGYYIKGHNLKVQADVGEITFGENFSLLSSLATRNVSPGLEPAKRLVVLPGTELKDKQARVQLTVQF